MRTEVFNTNRFLLLLKRQQVILFRTWLIALLAVTGAVMFVAFLNLIGSQGQSWLGSFNKFGVFAFFVTGLVFASMAFQEMGSYAKSLQYITLPATMFEKFFNAWLITSVIFVLIATLALVVASAIIALIGVLIFKADFIVFNPFTQAYLKVLLGFFIVHAAFFLGAVWFKKAAFFKTLLSLFVVNVILNIWLGIWTMLIINPFKIMADTDTYFSSMHFTSNGQLEHIITAFIIVLALFLLFVSWVRFKEREV